MPSANFLLHLLHLNSVLLFLYVIRVTYNDAAHVGGRVLVNPYYAYGETGGFNPARLRPLALFFNL